MVIAATGFFDGVHLGHRAVLDVLKQEAHRVGGESLVLSFWPHPRAVLQKDAAIFRLLNSLDEKQELMQKAGVDRFCLMPFTKDLAGISAASFFADYLRDQYHISTLVVGYDHKLGHNAASASRVMEEAAAGAGISLLHVPACTAEGITVSSTKIRMELDMGNIEQANLWLGYDYPLHGVVVQGKRQGRKMGFPTANMRLYEPLKQLPADGVYAVRVNVCDKEYLGMTNIGYCPTVAKDAGRTVETHILDFDEDIYGLAMELRFIKRLRAERPFPSVQALVKQLRQDKEQVRQFGIN